MFILYYALKDDNGNVPLWAKAVIVGALGYFISPIDALPDFLPGGYADDLAVLGVTMATVATYVSEDIVGRAKLTTERIFA